MSAKNRRYYRTLILSVVAMGALLYVAVDQFGIDWQVMRDLFLGVLVASGAIMLTAAAVALLWTMLRAATRRRTATRNRTNAGPGDPSPDDHDQASR